MFDCGPGLRLLMAGTGGGPGPRPRAEAAAYRGGDRGGDRGAGGPCPELWRPRAQAEGRDLGLPCR